MAEALFYLANDDFEKFAAIPFPVFKSTAKGDSLTKKQKMQEQFQKWMQEDFTKWMGEKAKALDHEFTYTIAFLGRPLVAWFRRRYEDFQASVPDYVTTAARSGNPFYIALSLSLDGAARVLRGEHDSPAGNPTRSSSLDRTACSSSTLETR